MTLQRAALWAIVVAATMYLIVAGRGLLLPFVLGIVLWYMVDALADAFENPRFGRLRLPRSLALIAAVCSMGGLLWVVGRTIGRNVTAVVDAAPTYERRLQNLIDRSRHLHTAIRRIDATMYARPDPAKTLATANPVERQLGLLKAAFERE